MSQWACGADQDPGHHFPLPLISYPFARGSPLVFPRTVAAAGDGISWELGRNASSQAPPQTNGIKRTASAAQQPVF